MKSCNNCAALGRECIVEPEDRVRSAENCKCYVDIDAVEERKFQAYLATGEWPFDMD